MNSFLELDRTCPPVPDILMPVADNYDPIKARELWVLILDEVCDKEYLSRIHHNVGTYDVGCRGPLCRKALREHPRRKTKPPAYTPQADRIYDPIIEFFHTVAKYRVREYRRILLERLSE